MQARASLGIEMADLLGKRQFYHPPCFSSSNVRIWGWIE